MSEGIGAPPPQLVRSGGFHQRERTGKLWRRLIVRDAGLPRDGAVLDVGCGLGRMALPLLDYLGAAGRYEGFDVPSAMRSIAESFADSLLPVWPSLAKPRRS